ncbi:MAG: dTDP-4-dehydrorhamnose 3,5-epimerase [Bacteroidales bacterium]|nr:dTDP-4-dehydrorhamnose 3,5-epimerase [Bacteroidales bacterium]
MKIIKTDIEDLLIIQPDVFKDERGYFFEFYNEKKLSEFINVKFVQDNESYSIYGVIRGLHYQLPPFEQAKLIRVVKGKIYDVAVDIRKNSKTFGKWIGIELNDTDKNIFFIPAGFAHGFSVLSDYAIVQYKCSNFYNKEYERGILYCDEFLKIDWKIDINSAIVSEKDRNLKKFEFADYFNY